jgi:hypothetical protein
MAAPRTPNQRPPEQRAPKGVTPPKGRPTRSRSGRGGRRRVFGPVAQWIAVTLFLILLFALLVIMTDGGDFNPFNRSGTVLGLVAAVVVASSALPG